MIEKITKAEVKEYFFEDSMERLKICVSLENISPDNLKKTKNFLETMFKEILNDFI